MSDSTLDRYMTTKTFIAGAAGTALAGLVVQTAVIPVTDVPDDRWSYPWASGPFVAISVLYILLHVLVALGLAAFGRSRVAGSSRSAKTGVALAIIGTLTLTAGEAASFPIHDALTDDTSAQIVGAVFGVGMLLSAIGLLLVGKATLAAGIWHDWRRYTPLAAGIWTAILIGLSIAVPKALPGGVAIYGACLLAMALALHRDKDTEDSVRRPLASAS